jgi:hypothetical protein
MIYSAIAREIWTRLVFHSQTYGLLAGLAVKKGNEFTITGEKDLPLVTMVDLTMTESVGGKATGKVSLFLRTKKKQDFVKLDPRAEPGLLDWAESLMDAIETAPSDLKPELLLKVHNADGTVVAGKNEPSVALLTEAFTWDGRMSEISEQSFLWQLDLSFVVPTGRRANRRLSPITADMYAL